ncbi:hypothetical protein [Flavobacterium sp.]|uniref:hypothetical protein n=1 Tax=Flavobacterium sp. TaxID=239 RepID=UPI0038FD36CE
MRHIRQINTVGQEYYGVVIAEEPFEQHPSIVNNPDLFEISEDEIPELHQFLNPDFTIKSVTKLQLKLALIDFGIMPSSVLLAINQIQNQTVKETFLTLWTDAVFFERNDPSLISMASTLGLTSVQVDTLFRLASKKL